MPHIYFDNNATTPLASEVKAVLREIDECFGNPSSIHWAGREARKLLNISREKIASFLGAEEGEILFTSGGTESINAALVGVWETGVRSQELGVRSRNQIISSPIEHHATLKTLEYLQSRGAEIIFLKVDRLGRIDLEELHSRMTPKTLLASLMFANNELGNLYPIEKVGEICREKGVFFHCDGVQAIGKVRIDLRKIPVDLFSFSAHKFHGPKGVGGLFVREGVRIAPLHRGGNQERQRRAGTENLSGINGMAVALELCLKNLEQDNAYILSLRNKLEEGILSKIDGVYVNGDLSNRLSNTTHLRVEGVDGETLLLNLDLEGVAVSAGAACESGSLDPSHVLLAMGLNPKQAKASIRFSLSKYNIEEEVDEVLKIFPKIIRRLRG
jgi:cysteine desulfurase